jgi:hypothetical protein
MSRAPVSQLPDAAMQGVDAALLRAAQRAREVARQTGTAIVIVRDGNGKAGVPRLVRIDYHGAKEVPTGTCQAVLKAAGLKAGTK